MNILTFDTSTPLEFIILSRGSQVFSHHMMVERTHSAAIFDNINTLLRKAGITLQDIDLIASGIGPGSFTGIRIAVSTARMLGQILNIPLIGIKSHELYGISLEATPGDQILVAFDAKKKRVFGALYQIDGESGQLEEIVTPGDYSMEYLMQNIELGTTIWTTGDGIDRYIDIVKQSLPEYRYIENFIPDGARINGLVSEKYKMHGEDAHYSGLVPFYARKSDAEIARDK